jgi:hypothetical protein
MAIRHQSRQHEYTAYVNTIIDLMKHHDPTLHDVEIITTADMEYIMEEHRIFPFMNVDIIVKNNNNGEEKLDQLHIHIPYALQPMYFKKYIQAAIVNTYFIDKNEGFSIINVQGCNIQSNSLDANQAVNINTFSHIFENDGQYIHFNTMGDIIMSLYQFDTNFIISSFDDINSTIKICVFIDNVRIQPTTDHQIAPNLNIWYDLSGDPSIYSSITYDVINLNILEMESNARRDLLPEFNLNEFAIQPNSQYDFFPEIDDIYNDPVEVMAYHNRFNYNYDDTYIPITNEPINVRGGECPICYDDTQIGDHYTCRHGICQNCYSLWQQHTCPMCRAHTRLTTDY